MPTYVYKFVDTGETIEVHQAFSDDGLTEAPHPSDGKPRRVKKVFTPVGITFKGGGFYKTDSTTSSKSDATSSTDSKSASTPTAGSDSSTSTSSSPSTNPPSTPPSTAPGIASTDKSASKSDNKQDSKSGTSKSD